MSEITLHFQVAGGDVLHRQLGRVALDLTDFTQPLRESGEVIYDAIRDEFATQGQTQTPKWPALSPRYAAWKARHYPGKPMLRMTDALMRSITGRGAQGAVYELSTHTLTLGTDIETPTGGWNLGLLHQQAQHQQGHLQIPVLLLLMV